VAAPGVAAPGVQLSRGSSRRGSFRRGSFRRGSSRRGRAPDGGGEQRRCRTTRRVGHQRDVVCAGTRPTSTTPGNALRRPRRGPRRARIARRRPGSRRVDSIARARGCRRTDRSRARAGSLRRRPASLHVRARRRRQQEARLMTKAPTCKARVFSPLRNIERRQQIEEERPGCSSRTASRSELPDAAHGMQVNPDHRPITTDTRWRRTRSRPTKRREQEHADRGRQAIRAACQRWGSLARQARKTSAKRAPPATAYRIGVLTLEDPSRTRGRPIQPSRPRRSSGSGRTG